MRGDASFLRSFQNWLEDEVAKLVHLDLLEGRQVVEIDDVDGGMDRAAMYSLATSVEAQLSAFRTVNALSGPPVGNAVGAKPSEIIRRAVEDFSCMLD